MVVGVLNAMEAARADFGPISDAADDAAAAMARNRLRRRRTSGGVIVFPDGGICDFNAISVSAAELNAFCTFDSIRILQKLVQLPQRVVSRQTATRFQYK